MVTPLCQSCGMPMQRPDDFGTTVAGARNEDYCFYCVRDGLFTAPEISLSQMIEKCVALMVHHGIMGEDQARALMRAEIPKLKRWR